MLDYGTPAAILDGRSYRLLRFVHQPSRAVWSNLDPRLTYGTVSGTNRFVATDMRSGRYHVLHAFTEYARIDFGIGEGNVSVDDRYAALFGVKRGGGVELFVYDIGADAGVSRLALPDETIDGASPTINIATMSPSGDAVVIEYDRVGLGAHSGIVAYDRALATATPLSADAGSHYDVCTRADGVEVIVVQSHTSAAIVATTLHGATTTEVLSAAKMSYPIHISSRNTRRRGWAYISEFAGRPSQADAASYQSVFAVKLDGSGLVERFAHEHHSASPAYSHELHAAPNHAGDRVLFASDWEDAAASVYAYVARARCRRRSASHIVLRVRGRQLARAGVAVLAGGDLRAPVGHRLGIGAFALLLDRGVDRDRAVPGAERGAVGEAILGRLDRVDRARRGLRGDRVVRIGDSGRGLGGDRVAARRVAVVAGIVGQGRARLVRRVSGLGERGRADHQRSGEREGADHRRSP